MRWIKRIIIWICISLCIQIGILYYVDKDLFKQDTQIKSVKVDEKHYTKETNMNISIHNEAKKIRISYDGKYVSYYINNNLKVVNTYNGEVQNIKFDKDTSVSYYRWVPNQNRILIGEKKLEQMSSRFKLTYYDAEKHIKNQITHLGWSDKEAQMQDIQIATLINVIYVKISNNKYSNIYKVDISGEISDFKVKSQLVGKIAVSNKSDIFIYEDLSNMKLSKIENNIEYQIKDLKKLKLLGLDDDDNVYLLQVNNGKVDKVFYTHIHNYMKMTEVNILKECNVGDIYFYDNDKIYINYTKEHEVEEIKTGERIKYSGKFLDIYDKGILILDNHKLVKRLF
ncbi:hypothetical protein ACFIJ5_05315 [Haloimpatiens sp. FM7330]|uniref:hypothetical protein n=1 Tax=Haloimpatiens sp. FM7330 TaxID=3298610 RepID=UPI003627DDCA